VLLRRVAGVNHLLVSSAIIAFVCNSAETGLLGGSF
jgi:hypothetical protein